MIRAGLLHLEIGYYGREPEGAVVPSNGNYAAIGSESSPGIQFLDSMGQHGLAARALRYFAEKQRENGFMQKSRRLHAGDRQRAVDNGRALAPDTRYRVGGTDADLP